MYGVRPEKEEMMNNNTQLIRNSHVKTESKQKRAHRLF